MKPCRRTFKNDLSESAKYVHLVLVKQLQLYYGISVKNDMIDGAHEACSVEETEFENELTEDDVPKLLDILIEGCYKWSEIGIGLGLKKYRVIQCKDESITICLYNVLIEWITGEEPASLEVLKHTLCKKTVELNILAKCLKFKSPPRKNMKLCDTESIISRNQRTSVDCDTSKKVQKLFNSLDTQVTEGRSTVLVFQVNCSPGVCQWSKDDIKLYDSDNYFGTSSEMLYVNEADLGAEGTYKCCVDFNGQSITSDEIKVEVVMGNVKKYPANIVGYEVVEDEQWPPVGDNHAFMHACLDTESTIRIDMIKTIKNFIVKDEEVDCDNEMLLNFNYVFSEYREGACIILSCNPEDIESTAKKINLSRSTQPKLLKGTRWCYIIKGNKSYRYLSELLWRKHNFEDRQYHESRLTDCAGEKACFIIESFDPAALEFCETNYLYQLVYKKVLPLAMIIVITSWYGV